MRRLMLCFAALALATAACGDDDDTAADPATTEDTVTSTSADVSSTSSTSSTTTSSSTTSSTSTTTAGSGGATVSLDESCDSPDGFTISYPADWQAVSDCGQFGPEPLDEPEPATDERTGVVSAFIDPVPFEQVAEPTEGDEERREETVDGRDAIRITGEQSGTGLYPEGTAYVRWLVDVSDGGGPATLFVDAYDLGYDIEFSQAVEVLDAMAQSLSISGR